jgi:HK97 family phage portal protein
MSTFIKTVKVNSYARRAPRKTVMERVRAAAPEEKRTLFASAQRTPPAIAGQLAAQGAESIIPAMYEAWGAYGWQPQITWYQLANMYVSWEYTATEKIARTLASLPAKLYRYENSQGKNVKPYYAKALMFADRQKNLHPAAIAHKLKKDHGLKRIEIDDHPFLDLVNKPNTDMVRYDFWRMLCIHLELDGAVGVYKARQNAFGNPTELHLLPATWTGQFKPIPETNGTNIIRGYRLMDQNINTDFDKDEIIWIHYASLRNPFEGMSAIKAQLYSFNMDQYLMQQINAFYKNGAMFSNVFETDQPLSQAQYNQIAEQLSNYSGAKNAGQKFILHSGLKVAQAKTETARQAMIDEIEKMARDKQLSAHDMSSGKLGLTEHQNRSNLETVDIGFYNEAIKPRAMLITEYFDQYLVKLYDENLDFEFDYPHFQDRAQDIAERTANLVQGVTTRNEERDKMGMEPVDGGDVLLVSPMLVPLSSVANPPKEETSKPEAEGGFPEKEPPPFKPNEPKDFKGGEGSGNFGHEWTSDKKLLAWKKFNAEATAYEPLFKVPFIKWFGKVQSDVIDNLEKHGVKIKSNIGAMNLNGRQKWLADHKDRLNEFVPSKTKMKQDLKEAFKPVYLSVMKQSGDGYMKDLAALVNKPKAEAAGELEFNLGDPKVQEYLGNRLDETNEEIAQTTIDKIKSILREDFEEGEPLLQMSTHLRDYFTGAEAYRAAMIARTETTSAMNTANLESVRQMDLTDTVRKVWITENDPQVRDTHAEAGERYSDGYDGDSGKVMGIDDDFVVGSDRMVSPAAGNVAEENINCRCTLAWEVIK